MRFYDTSRSRVADFVLPEALSSKPVRMYVCGVTPYDAAHMGHIFTFMTYDLLQRRLEDLGHKVVMVRNVTDVDEPIYAKAAELGIDYRLLAKQETDRLQSVLSQLNFRQADHEPKASDYIMEMADAVDKLLAKDIAYRLDDDIYFDVSKADDFGSQLPLPDRLLVPLMADRGGDPDRPGKRQPLDFLLWRGVSDPSDPAAWQTALGRGRPGWHIECTIMSESLLGSPFDIHGGGMDLIFPHHGSEIAQSQAMHGHVPARYWLHVAPLLLYGEKMSKSLGNLVFAHDLLREWDPMTIRLAVMHYHYRTGGEWHNDYLYKAKKLAEKLDEITQRDKLPDVAKYLERIRIALDNDLDTPAIIDSLEDMCSDENFSDIDLPARKQALNTIFGLLGLA